MFEKYGKLYSPYMHHLANTSCKICSKMNVKIQVQDLCYFNMCTIHTTSVNNLLYYNDYISPINYLDYVQ